MTALRGPEPCAVRGEYHQWAFLEREPGDFEAGALLDGRFPVEGPSRLVFFCVFCLMIRRLREASDG